MVGDGQKGRTMTSKTTTTLPRVYSEEEEESEALLKSACYVYNHVERKLRTFHNY